MKRFFRDLPLRNKIALFTGLVLGVSLFTLTIITIKLEETYSKNELRDQASILLRTLPYSMRDELYFVALDELKDVTAQVVDGKLLTRFIIYDRTGIILADSENIDTMPSKEPDPFGIALVSLPKNEEFFEWDNDHLIAGRAIFLETEQIGAVSVVMSTTAMESRINAIIVQSITISLIILLIGIVLSFMLAQQLSNPLGELRNISHQMASGKTDIRVRIAATDEIGELGTAFNDMAEAIQKREQDLRELTTSLEQKVKTRTEELRLRNLELTEMATSDPLTKINNRRRFFELAEKEYQRSKRYQHPLSMILIDADHFKDVNDTYGHQAGDRLLANLAKFFQDNIRSVDIVARYGGEEFIILMPQISCTEAAKIAERLRQIIMVEPMAETEHKIFITVSFGVACWDCQKDLSLDTLLYRADKALYQAKRDGRNRVTVWQNNMEK